MININVFKDIAFISACENGHVELVDWLYEKNLEKNT